MAEQNNDQNQDKKVPVFKLQKMFIRDMSFESPNAPDVFLQQNVSPKVELNLGLRNKPLQNDHYEITLTVNAKVTHGEENKTLFLLELEHGGVFLIQNIPQEHMPAILAVDCPTTLFPFTRQIISQLSVEGGFMPFLLDPINFLALYHNSQQQQQQQPTKQ